MNWVIAKSVCLCLAIIYTFGNFGKLIRGHSISMIQELLMAIGIVGFITIQFWLGY